jgi:hypothetical protein
MLQRPGWKYVPSAVSLLVIALMAANYFSPFADLDFTWQIRTGEEIVRTGDLRPRDAFTYTIAGRPVPEFEGVYGVGLWAVWKLFGFGGLKLLRVLCVCGPLLLVGLRLRWEGVRWRGVALALLVLVLVESRAWNLRPLYLSTMGLLLVSGRLHDHCTRRRPLPWWLPLLLLAWANLHPGVIMGQGLLVGAIGWEWLNQGLRFNTPLDRPALRRLTLVGGLALAATMVSPDPVGRLLYPFSPESHHAILLSIPEMRPLVAFVFEPPYTAGIVFLVAALTVWTVYRRFHQYRLWEIALLAGLAWLGCRAFRGVLDWLPVMLTLAVPHLARMLAAAARMRRAGLIRLTLGVDLFLKRMLHAPLFRWQWSWPAAALAALAVISVIPPLSRAMPVQNNPEWPAAAADWIDAHNIDGRIFAAPDDGAYLMWRRPSVRCYADTRYLFFPPELIEDCQYLPQLAPDWPERLRRVESYGTDYFLLKTAGPHAVLWRAVQPHIRDPLYCDESVVLLRADQLDAALAEFEQEQAANLRR